MLRAAERESERAEFTPPLLVSDLHYSQWRKWSRESVPDFWS